MRFLAVWAAASTAATWSALALSVNERSFAIKSLIVSASSSIRSLALDF